VSRAGPEGQHPRKTGTLGFTPMKIVESLFNRSEEVVFRELQSISKDNNLMVFAKPRLSDVIVKERELLTQREFDFYTRSHCDFVVTDAAYRPLMIVEYDGPLHTDEQQQTRDRIKDDLCSRAGLGMLRIHDRHVTELYCGMSVLRWIVEVTELQKAFYEAQEKGQIPYDEPFDPAMFDSIGGGRRFPYWLSAPATQSSMLISKHLTQRCRKVGIVFSDMTMKERIIAFHASILANTFSGQKRQFGSKP
jgi:very-short-patch-repair endonuclease